MGCRFVWLNQYADQFLPIVALVGLRVIVGLGDKLLKAVTRPKKDPMQVLSYAFKCSRQSYLFCSPCKWSCQLQPSPERMFASLMYAKQDKMGVKAIKSTQ